MAHENGTAELDQRVDNCGVVADADTDPVVDRDGNFEVENFEAGNFAVCSREVGSIADRMEAFHRRCFVDGVRDRVLAV